MGLCFTLLTRSDGCAAEFQSELTLSPCWIAKKLARPTRFERVTFAFGGKRSFFESNMGLIFRKPAVLRAQTLTPGSPPAGFLALSPLNLRWRLFYSRRGRSGTLLCGRGKRDW